MQLGPTAQVAPVSAFTASADASSIAPSSFRLGNASRPFGGWSTAIADFNTDGKPDFAIADHVARQGRGYAYRLELSISGEAPRQITFESPHEALTISVADVDRDNDLDLVVGAAASGEIVEVWLNDGHGHFTSADRQLFPVTSRRVRLRGSRIRGLRRYVCSLLPAHECQRSG